MTNELKPCPFCGSEGGVIPDSIKYKNGKIEKIFCVKCYCCSSGTTFYFDVDDAIEQWNERTEQKEANYGV